MAGPRPGGVTLVAVLAYLSGVLDVLGGVLLLVQSGVADVEAAFGGAGGQTTAAIGSIIVGLIILIVAGGLLRGNRAARAIVTVVEVLSLLATLWLLFVVPGNLLADLAAVLFSVLVLIFLWSRRASAFFGS